MPCTAVRQRIRSKLRPLHNPAFRGIYAGSICSGATDGIIPVAFAVYTVQVFGSAGALTTILITLWAARFACAPIAGAVSGSGNQITIMIASDVARIVAQAGLALVIIATGQNSLLVMSVSAGLYGAATAFYGPALYTVLPRIVPERDLRTANALLAMVADISVLVGPAVAIVLLETLGFVWILIFDSATFAANMFALMFVRRIAGPVSEARDEVTCIEQPAPTDRQTPMRAILAASPWLGWSVGLWFVVSIAIGAVAVAGPSLMIGRTGNGGQWAALATGMAVAGLAGSLALIGGLRQLEWRFLSSALGIAIVLELMAVVWYAHGDAGPVVLFAGCMVAGFVISVAGIVWQTLIQARLTTADLGRFSSAEGFVNAVGVPVGMAVGGLALSTIGIEIAAAVTILATIALCGAVRVTVGRSRRRGSDCKATAFTRGGIEVDGK